MPDQDGQPQQPPHSELASFGEELRREREIRGISLKEIADATKISKRFLEAIERNDHRTLPAPVFTRGFVREYAKYLGLNADEIVSRYNYAAAGDDRIEKSAHLERLITPPPPLKEKPFKPSGIPPWYARIDRNVIITVIIVAALGTLGYWTWRHKRESDAAARAEATTVATHPAPKPRVAVPPPVTTSSAQPADATLRLGIEATARTYLILEADDKTVYSDEMRKGERATYEAKDRFRFKTIGNAGGINMTLNDVAIPSYGGEGDVVHDKILDRDLLARLRAEPHPNP